jgi:phosphohistidine swiveling domain-containing protein
MTATVTSRRKTIVKHFTVTGPGFTRIVRDFMLSENPSAAWRLIATGLRDGEGLGGMTRYADKILDGKMKLVGNESRMHAAKDNATGYMKQLKYIYAGRIRINKAWYRPYAEVLGFGEKDGNFATKKTRINKRDDVLLNPEDFSEPEAGVSYTELREWFAARVAFYGREGDRVVAVRTREQKTALDSLYVKLIIFEPCSELPHWWAEHSQPEDALKDFLSVGRRLQQERASDHFEEDDYKDIGEAFAQGILAKKRETDEERDARYAREDKERFEFNLEIRNKVLAQAAGDMMDLHLDDGTLIATVPRAPFMHWALGRTTLKHLAPPWETVAPGSLKMPMDDPNHTDWFFGATLHVDITKTSGVLNCVDAEEAEELRQAWGIKDKGQFDYDYDHNSLLHKAASHEMFELQWHLGDFEAAVVVDAGDVEGEVGQEIVVLKDLQPDHVDKIARAKGIITETGGRVAHIAQLALERSITIMRVPDATTRYPAGAKLTLQPSEGKVHMSVKRW